MFRLHLPYMSASNGWARISQNHVSVLKLFFLYALPLSVLPPLMLNYAAATHGTKLLPALNSMQLQWIGMVFFLIELAMPFVVALAVQRITEWVVRKPPYEDAYKLAVVVATPLWFSSLFLAIPSFMLIVTAVASALICSAVLIYFGVASILHIEDKADASILFGLILGIGMVTWSMMMYFTLLTWSVLSVI